MSQSEAAHAGKAKSSLLIRGAIWIAIGALIAAALVCVIWVLIGDQNGLIGRAFLTILLLATFAGIAIAEASLAPQRPDWLALASMITWIVALLVGAVKIWVPESMSSYAYALSGTARFLQLLLVVAVLQLALLHVRLYAAAAQRYVTTFTRVIFSTTIVFLVGLVGMLVFFLTVPDDVDYSDLYWRIVVALTILVAVGTTLIPLLNALFAPKKARPERAAAPAGAQSWPTYADGRTPLPVLSDGSPDWNAYYTGYPTPGQQPAIVARPPQPQQAPAPHYAAAPPHDANPAMPAMPHEGAGGSGVPESGAPESGLPVAGVPAAGGPGPSAPLSDEAAPFVVPPAPIVPPASAAPASAPFVPPPATPGAVPPPPVPPL